MTRAAVARHPDASPALPAPIAGDGERAACFLEFVTVHIRNEKTRAAYVQAVGAFLRRRHDRGIRQGSRLHHRSQATRDRPQRRSDQAGGILKSLRSMRKTAA